MEVGLIFKIAAVGILVTILCQVLKHSGREEHSFLLSLAALILVLSWILRSVCDSSGAVFALIIEKRGEKMAEILKIGIFGLAGVMLAIQFKTLKPEYATYIGLGIGILVMGFVLKEFRNLVSSMETLKKYFSGAESYLTILIKVIGITYICEFCAGICKDAGYGSIADQIQMLGKLSVMFAGLPILLAVIQTLDGMII